MKLPSKTLEKKLFASGYRYVIGVDEVGMGCLAGPVVVCAVAFKKKFFNHRHTKLHWLRDSKLLLPKQREKYARELFQVPGFKFQVSYAYPRTIDKVNVYQASREAMRKAIKKITKGIFVSGYKDALCMVLVDGKTKIEGLNIEQIPIVKGDRKVFAIACASIIAKVHRDKMMVRYAKKYPGYGFEKHKGYGTKYHQAQLVAL